jgi:hypothetical protein
MALIYELEPRKGSVVFFFRTGKQIYKLGPKLITITATTLVLYYYREFYNNDENISGLKLTKLVAVL